MKLLIPPGTYTHKDPKKYHIIIFLDLNLSVKLTPEQNENTPNVQELITFLTLCVFCIKTFLR